MKRFLSKKKTNKIIMTSNEEFVRRQQAQYDSDIYDLDKYLDKAIEYVYKTKELLIEMAEYVDAEEISNMTEDEYMARDKLLNDYVNKIHKVAESAHNIMWGFTSAVQNSLANPTYYVWDKTHEDRWKNWKF